MPGEVETGSAYQTSQSRRNGGEPPFQKQLSMFYDIHMRGRWSYFHTKRKF
jgi:hypothetical protein